MEDNIQYWLAFFGRKIGSIGSYQSFSIPWVENPTTKDKLRVYKTYEHVYQPRLTKWVNHATISIQEYPEFYNL